MALTINNFPHIDTVLDHDIKKIMEEKRDIINYGVAYGYAMPHKHFDIGIDEVLYYTFGDNYIECNVIKRDDLGPDDNCVLYYPGTGAFIPIAYAHVPAFEFDEGEAQDYGICHPIFATYPHMLESIDVKAKKQWFVPGTAEMDQGKRIIKTMIYYNAQKEDYCDSYCHAHDAMNGMNAWHDHGHDNTG